MITIKIHMKSHGSFFTLDNEEKQTALPDFEGERDKRKDILDYFLRVVEVINKESITYATDFIVVLSGDYGCLLMNYPVSVARILTEALKVNDVEVKVEESRGHVGPSADAFLDSLLIKGLLVSVLSCRGNKKSSIIKAVPGEHDPYLAVIKLSQTMGSVAGGIPHSVDNPLVVSVNKEMYRYFVETAELVPGIKFVERELPLVSRRELDMLYEGYEIGLRGSTDG